MKEYKVGDIIEFKTIVKVVESELSLCVGCYGIKDNSVCVEHFCSKDTRTDGKSVVYELIDETETVIKGD